MGISVDGGKVTVSAMYGVTVNRGDFSSEKLSQGVTVEYEVDGVDSSAAVAAAEGLYEGLEVAVKTAVIKGLGLDADFDDNGVLLAKFGAPKAAPVASPQQSAPSGGSGGSQPQYKPKYDLSQAPKFTADLDGEGAHEWYDLRPQKTNPNASDFRSVSEGTKRQVWLKGKDGTVKASVASGLQAANISVD